MSDRFIVDKRTEEMIDAGVSMVNWARAGESKEYMWKELGIMGFSEPERVTIAKTVNGFMQHKNGNHEDCPQHCDQVEKISQETRGVESIQDVADVIQSRHDLHDSHEFSKDVQEEWR